MLRDADTLADRKLVDLASRPALSIITRVELEGGLTAEPELASRRRATLDRMLTFFPVLDFDESCADAYRRIVEQAGYSRRKVMDRLIAATALANGLDVVTANARDFVDIPDLTLKVWASA